MEAGVEPLRRIGRRHLAREHEAHLVVIGARVLFAVEIAGLPAPIGPGAGEAVEHLLRRDLRAHALVLRQRAQRRLVGDGAPQERGNALLLDALHPRRNAGFAEIFLRQNVGRDLAPGGGHFDALKRKHHRAVGIADFALGGREGNEVIRADARLRVMPFDAHRLRPHSCGHGLLATLAALILTPNRGAPHASPSAQAAIGWPGRPAPSLASNFIDPCASSVCARLRSLTGSKTAVPGA